jgi:hypothetical protein
MVHFARAACQYRLPLGQTDTPTGHMGIGLYSDSLQTTRLASFPCLEVSVLLIFRPQTIVGCVWSTQNRKCCFLGDR